MRFSKYINNKSGRNNIYSYKNLLRMTLEELLNKEELVYQNNAIRIPDDEVNVKGFIYNKSNNYVPRTFVTAHLAYWQTPKHFAKAIVKAFNEGYLNFYSLGK